MTENMAGRGEGLAGLAKSLLNECKGVLSLAEAEIAETAGITNLNCLKRRMGELETALEAAAPAGTAQSPTKAEQALCEAALVWFLTPEVLDDYEALQDSESASAPAEFLLLCEIAKDVLKERIAKTESK